MSVEFSRQEYWNRQLFSSPGDLPNSGTEPGSPTLWADSLPPEPPGNPFPCCQVILKLSFSVIIFFGFLYNFYFISLQMYFRCYTYFMSGFACFGISLIAHKILLLFQKLILFYRNFISKILVLKFLILLFIYLKSNFLTRMKHRFRSQDGQRFL